MNTTNLEDFRDWHLNWMQKMCSSTYSFHFRCFYSKHINIAKKRNPNICNMTPNMPWKKEECTYGLRGPLECYRTILDSFCPQLRKKNIIIVFFFRGRLCLIIVFCIYVKWEICLSEKKGKLTFHWSNNSHFA